MSTQGTIKRYSLIIEKIISVQHPSFTVLQNFLDDHGFEISQRTLQRDIEQIRNEFGIEISYNRSFNGYFINTDESINLESFLKFLEIMGTADLISDSLKEGKDALNFISFESQGNLRGIDNLRSLLFAIKNQREITFVHENYQTGKQKNYSMQPYLLKEYQNRWYVVGKLEGIKEYRTIGVDRIMELNLSTTKFKKDKTIDVAKLFENTIGLIYSQNKVEEVLLSFTPLEAKYAKSLPWHKSQVIVSESDKEVIISLTIAPNYELNQKILMMGDQIKVLKPAWLVKEIKDCINDALKRYRK